MFQYLAITDLTFPKLATVVRIGIAVFIVEKSRTYPYGLQVLGRNAKQVILMIKKAPSHRFVSTDLTAASICALRNI